MKFTAPTAMPTPKITPDKVRLAAPSPKANISPPTTIATNASPVAIGPVKAVCNACTACVQGESVDWANTSSASAMQVANVSKPFLRKRFGGLLRPAELGFEEFCIEGPPFSRGCHFFQLAAHKERGRQGAKPQCIKLSIFHEMPWVPRLFGEGQFPASD